MPQYRLYHLDGAGRVGKAEWLDASSDENAISAAAVNNTSVQCELWQGRRLVTRLAHGEIVSPGAGSLARSASVAPPGDAGRAGAQHGS